MKNKSITKKEVKEAEAFVKGPLMVYRPWTKQEETAMGDWAAKRKGMTKAETVKIAAWVKERKAASKTNP